MADLAVEAFKVLRDRFFNEEGKPIPFRLRPKRNTQDDPFDEYLTNNIFTQLSNCECEKAPGPLITPDLVLFRPDHCQNVAKKELRFDINRVLAIEVKKLERTKQGNVARSSGLDFNTTPPCGLVRVYDSRGNAIEIRSFYLFVCLEADKSDNSQCKISALSLVDGNVLNDDFEFYLSIVGQREKRIGLGSYRNGADRSRPMLIFANPLGVRELDHQISLIHPSGTLEGKVPELKLGYIIRRMTSKNDFVEFYCYRRYPDIPTTATPSTLIDPFPTPVRDIITRPRGRFNLPFIVRTS